MTCYDIFRKCFPQFELTEEVFNRLSNINNIHLITHEEKGELCGFALVEKMALRLICVSPEYQNNGIGTTLLKKAENYIKQNGGNEILTGGASSQLLIGTPDNAVAFFKKDGFKIVGSCDEMTIDIHSFNSENSDLFQTGDEYSPSRWYDYSYCGFTIKVNSITSSNANITIEYK